MDLANKILNGAVVWISDDLNRILLNFNCYFSRVFSLSNLSSILSGKKVALFHHFCRSLLKASIPYYNSSRTVVRFSMRRGRPKTVKQVIYRFFRLHSGIWIRTFAGRKKRLWKRNVETRQRFRYHIFCNKTQSRMLDKMVTGYWKKPRHYVDDPYAPYHLRHGLNQYFANQKIPGRPKWYPWYWTAVWLSLKSSKK